jgi:hypothetical protein
MPAYKVLSPVDHDGTLYEVDSSIELSEEAGAALVALGALAESKESVKSESEEPVKASARR